MEELHYNKTFERIAFTDPGMQVKEFESCTFKHCDWGNSRLSNYIFIDCTFIHCNLSTCTMEKSRWQQVVFDNCKMLGLRFDTVDHFDLKMEFSNCILNHSSFFELKLKKTKFENCQLREVDFTSADLNSAVFKNCDLADAKFEFTDLGGADFSSAYNYFIDPDLNKLKGASFSLAGLPGLLAKYGIKITG